MKGESTKTFTGDQVDEIARRYRAGENIDALAAAFKCSSSPIRNALRMRAVRMRTGANQFRRGVSIT